MSKEELAKKAANWWTEQYTHPRFDNGDDSTAGGVGVMLAMMGVVTPTEEIKNKFRAALEKRILSELENGRTTLWISADYAPEQLLADVCIESGMSTDNTPWKADMEINLEKGTVRAKVGYAKPMEEI